MSEEPSSDSVTEVTTTGWLQRIVQSFVGAGIWVLLGVVEANASAVDPANNNKLVHLSGAMTTRAPARDTAFGIGGDDLLRLKRTVEMFQWTEQKSTRSQKNFGGSETTETTYSYHKE